MEKHTIEGNCELLFEYLRSTLYDLNPKEIKIEDLDLEFKKLGMGIAYTQQLIMEQQQYSAAISKGDLNPKQPSKDNLLCSNLKNLHSNLKHLTWQAKQVAKGDYSQHVSYLGEFSDAFNEMIHQLKERDDAIRRRTRLMEEYNRFFLEMSSKREEWIIIVSEGTRKELYCNRQTKQDTFDCNVCEKCSHYEKFIKNLSQNSVYDDCSQQEVSDGDGKYYEISAFHMEWSGEKAISFVIKDITKEKEYSNYLNEFAYNDALTGAKNRRYFDEYLKNINLEDIWDAFCYMDLDGLKYVNDNFGHDEGDYYIKSFADKIKHSFRQTDVLIRIGGDEFCMFCQNISTQVLEAKIENIRAEFIAENKKNYPVSFSYGIIENVRQGQPFAEVMKQADEKMYQYKKMNKKERK